VRKGARLPRAVRTLYLVPRAHADKFTQSAQAWLRRRKAPAPLRTPQFHHSWR